MNQGFRGWSQPGALAVPYICIRDVKADGTGGGSFASGSFVTRTLNNIQNDDTGAVQVINNQIILPPGRYRCHVDVPAYGVADHQARLRDMTNGVTLLTGISGRSTGSNNYDRSTIMGKIKLFLTTAIEVQHRCETSNLTDGLGRASNFTSDEEVYTVAEFWKEG